MTKEFFPLGYISPFLPLRRKIIPTLAYPRRHHPSSLGSCRLYPPKPTRDLAPDSRQQLLLFLSSLDSCNNFPAPRSATVAAGRRPGADLHPPSVRASAERRHITALSREQSLRNANICCKIHESRILFATKRQHLLQIHLFAAHPRYLHSGVALHIADYGKGSEYGRSLHGLDVLNAL